jgi:hypothetical protein
MIGASDERLVQALVEKAQRGMGLISQEQLDEGWRRLQSPEPRARALPARRPVVRTWLAGFATASVLASLAVMVYQALPMPQPPALRYVVQGTAATSGNLLTSLPGQQARLQFSDDSQVDLEAATKINVDVMDALGAHVVLLDGAVDVYVKHRANTSWVFAAGPFRVKVKGTAFRLGFAADQGYLTLHMTSGLVEVFAPADRTIVVGAGESLELYAAPPRQAEAAPPVAQPDPARSAGEVMPDVGPPRGKIETPRLAGRRPAPHASERGEPVADPGPIAWSELLARGSFSSVVADAERRGLSTVIAQATAAELASLADSARYTKRHALAHQVLLAIRARFVGTEHARDASFFLGRLAEASSSQPGAALAWYDTYLGEAPRGLYASEALGREMTLLARSAPERACKVARSYLERFPHGFQTELARSLLESDPE